MVNLVQKFFTRPINKISVWLKKRRNDKLLKDRWDKVFKANYSYGFLLETIQIKLIKMYNEWPEYKNSKEETDRLKELILSCDELLKILDSEDERSHLRSNEYKIKQKTFFRKLEIYTTELFY